MLCDVPLALRHHNGVAEIQKDREAAQMARVDEERGAEEESNAAESRAHTEWLRQLVSPSIQERFNT